MSSKYIDAEKLKELIDEKWKELADKNVKAGGGKWDAEISTYLSVLRLIATLEQEQPEVDLGKSRNLIRDTLNGVTRLGSLCDDQTIEQAVDILIDKLGLNARKV